MTWEFHQASDIGGRDEQQDRAAVFALGGGAHLVALADGMGGHAAGALAAQTVIDTVAAAVGSTAAQPPQTLLVALCEAAHAAVRGLATCQDRDPGSTCVLLYLRRDIAYWSHVGDSRLYHLNRERAIALTEDHSAQGLVRTGAVAAGPAAGRGLYMCLGGQNPVAPVADGVRLAPGDALLLCSDGLWEQVEADEIRASLANAAAPGDALHRLVEAARERAGSTGDNVSAVLATRRVSRVGRAWRRLTGFS